VVLVIFELIASDVGPPTVGATARKDSSYVGHLGRGQDRLFAPP